MRLALVLSMSGLMLCMSGCAPVQWLTRTECHPQPVPAEYLAPTETPAPSPRIDQCPIWAEALKSAIQACNADKADIQQYSDRLTGSDNAQ